jgi:beta-mannosidase
MATAALVVGALAWVARGGSPSARSWRARLASLAVDRDADERGFALTLNGTRVFCRGACWTTNDVVTLAGDEAQYRAALTAMRDAGMNMVRIGGTMTYEPACFHDLCDELGILVWQDLMFANMDYPWDDESLARTATREITVVRSTHQSQTSRGIVCGNSEVDQQAALLGLPAARRQNHPACERLADLVSEIAPSVAWLPSTPTGGTLPVHPNAGVSHYYGVGAYRRPFDDARRAQVRFAAECLGFSNVPEPASLERMFGREMPGLPSRWASGVPRDPDSSWNFENVRDHYVAELFAVDPAVIRAADPDQYLTLGRIATGEAMLRTFSEWRRPGSSCRGGLVWFARDLRPGAGWGIADAIGRPKSVYWYLKRVLAPVALLAIDEGLNGLWLHAVNDTDRPVDADLHVAAYRNGLPSGMSARTRIEVPPRGSRSVHADSLFDGFRDLTYAYRFGPPAQDAVCASLRDSGSGKAFARASWTLLPRSAEPSSAALRARIEVEEQRYVLVLDADRFLDTVLIDLEDWLPEDNYLYLEPGESRRVPLRPLRSAVAPRGGVTAVTLARPVPVTFAEAFDVG